MNTLKKLNESKLVVILVFAAIFLIILYCNFLTPLLGDDYTYAFDYNGERLKSLSGILKNLYEHRIRTNGRVIPHFFVELFMMQDSLTFFKFLNAAGYTLLVFLFYYIPRRFSPTGRQGHNAMLVCAVMGALWLLTPSFGDVYLWLDGSFNYMWAGVLLLLWLLIIIKDYMEEVRMSIPAELLFALFSLMIGNYSENSSVSAGFVLFVYIVLNRFYLKRPVKRWHITSFCALMVGFLLLALAPAESVTKISFTSFSSYVQRFIDLVRAYLNFWPLILFYIFSYWYSFRTKQDKKLRVLSLVFIFASLAAHFVLIFALYFGDRSTFIALAYLLLACTLLFCQLFGTKLRAIYSGAVAVLLAFTLYWGAAGIQDMRLTHYKWEYNVEYIKNEVACGRTKIQVPLVVGKTDYSLFAFPGAPRLEKNHYANIAMANYYGADEISGYWFYELEE